MSASGEIEDLLRAAARGDRAAFQTLYERASPKLFAIIRRICGDGAMAEDALQDAFLEIWRKAGRFDPARGGGAVWMTVIARSRAIDLVRRRGRGLARGEGEGDAALAAVGDPKARADGGVEAMALSQCLARLDDRSREAVLLAYRRGMSREELAAHFDAPVNTVKTWLRRGLANLRACLEA